MDPFENLLKKIGPLIHATETPSQKTPPELVAALDAIKVNRSTVPAILSEMQMRMLILRLIGEHPLDGPGIILRLDELKVSLTETGSLFVYAILYDMEQHGLLKGRRNVGATEIVKTYHLTDAGDAHLKQNNNLVALPLSVSAI